MVRIRLSKAYAKMLAEKALELANMALAGIVFVQFLPEASFKGSIAVLGILIFVILHVGAFLLMKRGGRA